MRTVQALAALLLMSCGTVAWAQDRFGPFNLDGGKIACNDDSGPEIKKTQVYSAPPDRFFVEKSILVQELSGWGKKHYCEVSSLKKKPVTARTDMGDITFEVVYEFAVFAHADCGSGWDNNSGGKTASIECTVSAEMQKYTNR